VVLLRYRWFHRRFTGKRQELGAVMGHHCDGIAISERFAIYPNGAVINVILSSQVSLLNVIYDIMPFKILWG
jgi:hypothetical protein